MGWPVGRHGGLLQVGRHDELPGSGGGVVSPAASYSSAAHATLRRRIRLLHDQIEADRKHEIGRGVELQSCDPKQAVYHVGLADGRNAMLAELRILMREYPAKD